MTVDASVLRNVTIRPLKNHILIQDMNFGERKTKSGLLLPGDNGVERGLRPRWGKVIAVGDKQHDVEVGDWILISHGRWTRKVNCEINGEIKEIRMVDPKDVLGKQTEEPEDNYVADSITNKF